MSLILAPGAFRLALALAVVVSHMSRFDIGRIAVILFFLLSGYWTARIWTDKFAGERVGGFIVSRVLRIMPLYLIVLVGACAIRDLPLSPASLALLGVATTGTDPTGVAWSLDVELQFYLLFPFLACALARLPRAAAMAGSLVLAALGLWIQAAYGLVSVATFLPAFVAGALLAQSKWRPTQRTAVVGLLLFAAASAATAFTPFLTKGTPDPFNQDIYAFLWMLPLAPYIARSLTVRSSPLDRHLGNLSFPLYLVHYPLFVALDLNKAAEAGLALAVALVLYVALDRPIDAWRVRLTERALRERTA